MKDPGAQGSVAAQMGRRAGAVAGANCRRDAKAAAAVAVAVAVANPYGVDAGFAPAMLPVSGAPDERLTKQK